jgi:hypothetical protein
MKFSAIQGLHNSPVGIEMDGEVRYIDQGLFGLQIHFRPAFTNSHGRLEGQETISIPLAPFQQRGVGGCEIFLSDGRLFIASADPGI